MLDAAAAESVGLAHTVKPGMCACCGKHPAVPGKLLCHECRVGAEITEQPHLFEEES